MKNMSFSMTAEQVANRTKDVTRRMGWQSLKPGHTFQPVVKGMGLKRGEKVILIGGAVTVVSNRREPLRRMTDEPDYGRQECAREGFPDLSPQEFVQMYCKSNKGCTPDSLVSRIEFFYWPVESKESTQ